MNDIERELRERLTIVARTLYDEGLTYGSAGNISARIPETDTCLIKPSGYRFRDLEPDHFIIVDINTRKVLKGSAKPSIETPFHIKLYQHWEEAEGVVHIHPRYSIILATLRKKIIPMGLDLFDAPALAKGIPLSRFAPPGTEELADNLVEAMKEHVACLMPQHGITTIGRTIEEAATNSRVVETLAQRHYDVMLVGDPVPLPDSLLEMLVVMAEKNGLLV